MAIRNGCGIKLGKEHDKRTDLCYPIRVTGKIDEYMYEGGSVVPQISPFTVLSCDCTFKTKRQVLDTFWRFAFAHNSFFGGWQWGKTRKSSFEHFCNMMRGRYDRSRHFDIYPQYIKARIRAITPKQFGYDGWGMF